MAHVDACLRALSHAAHVLSETTPLTTIGRAGVGGGGVAHGHFVMLATTFIVVGADPGLEHQGAGARRFLRRLGRTGDKAPMMRAGGEDGRARMRQGLMSREPTWASVR